MRYHKHGTFQVRPCPARSAFPPALILPQSVPTTALQRRFLPRRRLIIETLRVSGSSRPNSVAGAIAALLRSQGEVEVQAIGPQAVNQAVKAIAIARSYIEPDGLDLYTWPSFVKLELQNEERTAVRFSVRSQARAPA